MSFFMYMCVYIYNLFKCILSLTLFLYSVFPHQHPNSDPAFPMWPMLIF